MEPSYRSLDPQKLIDTVDKIAAETNSTFPESGLAKVSNEVAATTRSAIERAVFHTHPLVGLRWCIGFLVAIAIVWPLLLQQLFLFEETVSSLGEFLEATDAGLHLVLVLGGGLLFLMTMENRIKRSRILSELSELRSLAHIIDMHQITKDPGMEPIPAVIDQQPDTRTVKSDADLALYLDFSSDMLAMIGKLAAYYAQHHNDREVLNGVNEIEILTNSLSRKLWQKVSIINLMSESQRNPDNANLITRPSFAKRS